MQSKLEHDVYESIHTENISVGAGIVYSDLLRGDDVIVVLLEGAASVDLQSGRGDRGPHPCYSCRSIRRRSERLPWRGQCTAKHTI